MKQESHTRNEQMMLQAVQHPFIINLWGTFQDTANLYMVMDFVPGGELFTLLRRSNVSPSVFVFAPSVRIPTPSLPFPAALPGPGGEVLRGGGRARVELSALKRHHLP